MLERNGGGRMKRRHSHQKIDNSNRVPFASLVKSIHWPLASVKDRRRTSFEKSFTYQKIPLKMRERGCEEGRMMKEGEHNEKRKTTSTSCKSKWILDLLRDSIFNLPVRFKHVEIKKEERKTRGETNVNKGTANDRRSTRKGAEKRR